MLYLPGPGVTILEDMGNLWFPNLSIFPSIKLLLCRLSFISFSLFYGFMGESKELLLLKSLSNSFNLEIYGSAF